MQVASFSQNDSIPNTIETSGNIEFSIDSINKGEILILNSLQNSTSKLA